ncbi:MAG: hypothetical protein MUQ56_10485 [Thermoleophilia bacterium]|nr:hypothetical protein [Thermoleophilia bacterium]
MAAFVKFNDFVEQVGLKNHNLNTDTLKAFLTNEQPLATDTVKGDMAEISAGNGYTAGGEDTQNVWSEASGTASVVCTDIVWTCVTAPMPTFRFVVIYNDSGATKYLVGWYDYGVGGVSLLVGETFTLDFGASLLTLA